MDIIYDDALYCNYCRGQGLRELDWIKGTLANTGNV